MVGYNDQKYGGASRPAFALADKIAIGVLVVAALVAAATFRNYGLGWDDFTHSQMGDLLLALYGSGFADRRALSFVNLYMYGGGFDMMAALIAKVLPFDLFETRRLVGAFVGIAGLVATWRAGRRLGGPLAGSVALLLLTTCPLYVGHSFINPKDGPFAVTMAVLLLGCIRIFQEYPAPTRTTVALIGIGLGLSVGSRVLGDLSVLFAGGALAVVLGVEWRSLGFRKAATRAGNLIVVLLPGLAIAYLIMALVWPWAVVAPLNPIRALDYFADFFEKPWKELYAGALVSVPDMPRSYVPTLLALQLPEIFLVLGVLGLIITLMTVARGDTSARRRAALLYVVLAAIVPVAITIIERPAMYNGIRHFVFILPPMAILGGLAADQIIERLKALQPHAIGACGAIFVIGITLPFIEIVRLHPYEYTYFNQIAGGMPGANGRYMRDYWGLSFKQAAEELRSALAARGEKPPSGQWKVAACGPHPPARVALGPQFDLTWDPKGADFALMLGEFYCASLEAPVLVEVKREGVTYARAYDLRGHQIDTLFTLPPVE